MARAFGAEDADAGLQVQYAFTWQSLLIAFALGVLLTLLVVAFSAWRVSVMTIAAAIRNVPEPPVVRKRRRIVLGGIGIVLGLLLAVGAGGGDAADAGCHARRRQPRAVRTARRRPRPARLHRRRSGERRALDAALERVGVGLRAASDGLLDVDRGRPHGRRRRRVGDRLQRRSPARRGDGRLRPDQGARADPADVDGVPPPEPVPTGTTLAMFTLVVFTLVTGSTSTGSFQSALDDVDVFGGGFQVRAGTGAVAPIEDLRSALDQRLGGAFEGLPRSSGASPCSRSTRGSSGRAGRSRATTCAGSTRRSSAHDLRARGHGARIHELARGLGGARREPGLAVVDSLVVPHRDQFGFAVLPSDFEITGLYSDVDEPFDPIPLQGRRLADREGTRLTVIGVLSDSAPFEMAGSRPPRRPRGGVPRQGRPTIHYFAVAPGVDPDRRPRGSSPRSSRTGSRPSRSARSSRTTLAAQQDVQPPDPGLHGARPRRGRRGARRDQRPRGRRAPPADRRDAGDRVPPLDDPGGVPARVVVRRAHGDLRRHARSACSSAGTSSRTSAGRRAGRTSPSSCRGATSRSSSRSSTPSRSSRRSPRRSGRPGSHRPRLYKNPKAATSRAGFRRRRAGGPARGPAGAPGGPRAPAAREPAGGGRGGGPPPRGAGGAAGGVRWKRIFSTILPGCRRSSRRGAPGGVERPASSAASRARGRSGPSSSRTGGRASFAASLGGLGDEAVRVDADTRAARARPRGRRGGRAPRTARSARAAPPMIAERERQAEHAGADGGLGRAADRDPDRQRLLHRPRVHAPVVERGRCTPDQVTLAPVSRSRSSRSSFSANSAS